uniref:Transmembrane protein 238 n=1 Tax=Takifugu rubripes TaxID=31033 RepID=A0A3B5KL94_TAKRU
SNYASSVCSSASAQVPRAGTMELLRRLGGCVPLFLFALVLDALGLILLFIGIFANLRLDGRFYGDFFIFTGALVVFLSLFFWIFWYAGNVPAPARDELKRSSSRLAQLARKLSERLGEKLRGPPRLGPAGGGSQAGSTPPPKASRVTWGKSTVKAFHNQGYEHYPDPDQGRPEPTEGEENQQI